MIITRRVFNGLAAVALSLSLLPLGAVRAAAPAVAAPFRDYYNRYQGIRVLGNPLTDLQQVDGYPAQYFEKGRIEDHSRETSNPSWKFMYGRLTAELMTLNPGLAANATRLTYADLLREHGYRTAAPAGFTGGTARVSGGVFVPFDAQLRAAPGFVVPDNFWSYINRTDLFPGGWLHDIGLPMTAPLQSLTAKNGEQRLITLQAFERAVLTFDPQNPAAWQVERGNIGTDRLQPPVVLPAPNSPAAVRRQIQQFLQRVATDPQSVVGDYGSLLTSRAQARYLGTGRATVAWINSLLGIQNTLPLCSTGDDAICLVQIGETPAGQSTFTAERGQITARLRWGSGTVTDYTFHMLFENGRWAIDEVTGVNVAADNRLAGEAQATVGGFFSAWQRGQIAVALGRLTPALRERVGDEAQLRTWLGLSTAPRIVDVRLAAVQGPSPVLATVAASLLLPDGTRTERHFAVVESGPNSMAIDEVVSSR